MSERIARDSFGKDRCDHNELLVYAHALHDTFPSPLCEQVMRRPTQQFVTDIFVAVAFVLLIATGVLMKYVLPPGSGRGATVLTLDRHGWGDIHFWIAITMVGLIVVHLLLHSKWIATMVKGKNPLLKRRRAALGIGAGIVLIFVIVLPLLLPVARTDSPGRGGSPSSDEAHVDAHGGQNRSRGSH